MIALNVTYQCKPGKRDEFLEKILAEVDRYCMTAIRPTVDIKNASLGDDSVIYGCLALIEAAG